MSASTIRLEEYTGVIQNKLIAAYQDPETISPWLPTEFLLSTYITRILITGRVSPLSIGLAADPNWTQVWRSPGGKEWSCLLSILQYMPGPLLLCLGPDIVLTPKLVQTLRETCSAPAVTVCILRVPGLAEWVGEAPDQIFFPVVGNGSNGKLLTLIQDHVGKTMPRNLDVKTLLPQLATQGYALTIDKGTWHWYKPADSPPLATLTIAQLARQLQQLGVTLERMTI